MGKQQKNKQANNTNLNKNNTNNTNIASKNDKSKQITKNNNQVNNNKKPNNQKFNNQQKNEKNNKNSSQPIKKQVNNNIAAVKDQRFAKAAYDPRFLRPKKQLTKIKIDDRFTKMLTDPAFKNTTKVDKYGRKISSKPTDQNEQLKQYYQYQNKNQQNDQQSQLDESNQQIDEQQQSEQQYQQNSQEQQQHDDNQSQQQMDEQEQQQQADQQDDQPHDLRKWMEQYDEQSSSLGDMPVEEIMEQENQGPEVWSDDEENVIKNDKVKATKRLALCNYDWMNISSKDLMILFNSFKSPAGFIKSIKVYQSLLGKEKMEQEEKFGPQGIWNDNEEDEFVKQDENKNKKWRKTWKQLLNKQDSSALDSRKLRAYEKQRLKYFYAVIQCDSKKTADQIYKQCDGNQFQHSNLQFDLRFIPDDISFDKTMLKQQCDQMPMTGEVKNFVNRAMGHSKVQLTWEDPELGVAAGLKKKNWGKMTQQELNKIDWSTYLNEQQIQQDEHRQQLFTAKQQRDSMPEWKKQCNKKFKNQNQKEKLVISFDSGFGPSKNVSKKPQAQQVPSLKKQKKTQRQLRQRAEQQRKRKRQDLALIAQDNDQQQRQKNFKADVKDQRFGAVYNNPLFSIDPSNPKFDHRKMGNVFKQVVQRNKSKNLL